MSIDPYAIVQGGIVTNVCLWDGLADWAPPDGSQAINIASVDPQPGIGWTYSSGTWSAPSPVTVVPVSVSRFQAMAALSNAGLLTEAQTAVNAAGGVTLLAWNNALDFERASPTIAALGQALGLTSDQIDALFIAAAQITA